MRPIGTVTLQSSPIVSQFHPAFLIIACVSLTLPSTMEGNLISECQREAGLMEFPVADGAETGRE